MTYKTKISDAKWMAYDIPGNIGWIAYFAGFGKLIRKSRYKDAVLTAFPAALMATGLCELINERIEGLDRELPARRLYRGFGTLTLGGVMGIAASLLTGAEGKSKLVMSGGAALCALFSGLIIKEYSLKDAVDESMSMSVLRRKRFL